MTDASLLLDKSQLLEIYRDMITIRRFEEKAMDLFGKGLIPGLIHLSIGQEAVATGVCANLRKDDYILSTHRGHGHCLAKHADPSKMLAELLGKETGYCKGRGGSMHIGVPDLGILGCTGVVGAGIPIATGVGLSIQVRGTDQVVVSFFGEGASNSGAFHEGINLAAIWNLPVIFVCENNLYMEFTPIKETTRVSDMAEKAAAYKIPSEVVDGMDVMKVYQAAGRAVQRARSGNGPSLLEFKTYRYRGHHEGDVKRGATYRSEEEIKAWEARDPILSLRNHLLKSNGVSEEELTRIQQEVEARIGEAADFAIESPSPSPGTVTDYVFVSK
jgi:TPP-dependent pyruvate/acetoin dehydrogenase alpha subunit